jgi:putative transposase
MTRQARVKSKSNIYHIMIRGINWQDIFHDDEDRQRFLNTLQKVKDVGQCEIYGYCLMDNHAHLMLKEKKDSLSQIMKRLGTSYVYWHNKKYERSGHLFQDRFKSENVEDNSTFLSVLRHIHQNPLTAQMVKDMNEYVWSSYSSYTKPAKKGTGLVDRQVALSMFSQDPEVALEAYIQYMECVVQQSHLEYAEKREYSDNKIKNNLGKLMNKGPIPIVSQIETGERNEILKKLKDREGSSIRQIERITGIGRNNIVKV